MGKDFRGLVNIRNWHMLLLAIVIVSLVVGSLAVAHGDMDDREGPLQIPPGELPYMPDEVIISLRSGSTDMASIESLSAKYGGTVARSSEYLPGVHLVRLSDHVDNVLPKLQADSSVLIAERNYKYYPMAVPNDPMYPVFRYAEYSSWLYGQYAYQYDPIVDSHRIYAPQAWDLEKGKNHVVVAVLDTGVRTMNHYDDGLRRRPHPDLGRMKRCPNDDYPLRNYIADIPDDPNATTASRLLYGYDFAAEDLEGFLDESPSDSDAPHVMAVSSHGTMVAGVIAAKTNNEQGIAGLCWNGVWVLPLKVFHDDASYALHYDIAQAIAYSIYYRNTYSVPGKTLRVDVINLSLGAQYPSPLMRMMIAQAHQSGIIIVAASGNAGSPWPPVYPAAYEGVIGVGATGYTDTVTTFSQRGHAVDIVAPGYDILTTAWRRWRVDDEGIDAFNADPPDGQGGMDRCPVPDNDLPPMPTPPPGMHPAWEGFDIWGNGYAYASGTSLSAPMVSAAAALLRSLDVPAGDVKQILLETATPRGVGHPNESYGFGLLNVYEAVRKACIDVKIQTPSNNGLLPTRRPKLRVDFRRADPQSIRIWLNPVNIDDDGIPAGAPILSGTDPNFHNHYYVLDARGGKSYVEFEYEIDPGRHVLYAMAETSLEFDMPPPEPLIEFDEVVFNVEPRTFNRGWHLFSLPYHLDNETMWEDLFPGSGVLARWHYGYSPYPEYAMYSLDGSRRDPEGSTMPPSVVDAEDRFEAKLVHPSGRPYEATPPAGLGYWIYLNSPLEFPESTGVSVDRGPYEISLYSGWNMVGNPFPFPVDWATVIVEYAGERVTAAEAVRRGWLFNFIFRYDNVYRRYVTQTVDSAIMHPWQAEWVRVGVRGPNGWPEPDIKLIVPPNPTAKGLSN